MGTDSRKILLGTFLLVLPMQGQPKDHLLIAVSQGSNTLAIFKVGGNSLTPVKSLPIGQGAREVCVSADGRRAYASNDKDGTVTVADLEEPKAIATIALPGLKRPDGCATSPDSKKLYVAALESDTVAVISTDTNTIIKQ